MTQRLTDDEIRALKDEKCRKLFFQGIEIMDMETGISVDTLRSLLDEIEERRRIDARRLADAEQAFREECEAGKDGGA